MWGTLGKCLWILPDHLPYAPRIVFQEDLLHSFLRDQSKNDQFAVSWIIFLACLAIFRYLQMLCSSLNVMIISYRVSSS